MGRNTVNRMMAMSILAKIATTAPTTSTEIVATAVFAAVCIVIGLTIAWGLGVFRRASVRGPVRIGGELSVLPILLVTAIAGSIWIGTQVGYATYRAAEFRREHPGEKFDMEMLDGKDFAFLSTVPFAVGWILLLIGDAATRQRIASRLGYGFSNIPSGVLKGMLAMTVTMPLMQGGSMLLELFYHWIDYKHPMEHELLGAMKDASPHVRMMLVIGACVAAPVFEEFLFRGHIQSVVVRFFSPRPMPVYAPLAVLTSDVVDPASVLPIPPPVLDYNPAAPPVVGFEPVEPSAGMLSPAILITAFIFSIVHPPWMAPLIFLLAVCLGYAYERTGNLWTTVTMHAIFNLASTVVFLNFM